ncbi:MAG: tetratricopeptide repeat protein, partial [candidate division Zixibacteria bacterium]|nr:tetratricopeptide repeat protein [candidate division Zixibacteria bacterium]
AFIKLKEAVTLDTENVDAYVRLGGILRRAKKPEQALQVHRDLTFRHNLTAEQKQEILTALYHDFTDLKDDASAIRAANEILTINPNDRFALTALLRTQEKAGEWKEASVIRRKLDKLDGVDSGRILALYKVFEGEELVAQGDPHRGRLFFKEAIHLDKMCLAAYLAIGDSYFNEKRLEDAIGYWSKVITLRPDMGHLVFERLKKGFFEVGRYGDYAETLTGLLQADPAHLTARLELAYFMEKKGEMGAARDHYSAALDHHPDSMLARLGLYRMNWAAGKREAADAVFKQIMKMAVKREAGNFRCKTCSLDAETMIWRCPRCRAIDSFEPVKS